MSNLCSGCFRGARISGISIYFLFARVRTFFRPFPHSFCLPDFLPLFLKNLLQFPRKSGILYMAFEENHRFSRVVQRGAGRCEAFPRIFRRKSVSTFQAAGEEPEVRALYRTVEWFRFLSEQFGWQHGAYSSHTMVDGYAFFHSRRRISYIIIRSRLC